jgi:hypothetical protein
MARMRNVDPFPLLWERRTTIEVGDETIDLLALPDLVRAKKTQRDKDWPMIRRLVDRHYLAYRNAPTNERIHWWLKELRTPTLLREAAQSYPEEAQVLEPERPLLASMDQTSDTLLESRLEQEEADERKADRIYWAPLRLELETLRREERGS